MVLLATSAAAQPFEAGVFGGASRINGADLGTFTQEGAERIRLKNGWKLGGRMTINNWAFFGHEVGYAYNRTTMQIGVEEAGTAIHQGFYNFLAYATPEGSRVRPFATGGVHFSNFIFPGLSVTSGGGSNKIGVNYGGGIKIKVSPKYLIRFDVRQFLQGKPFDFPGQSGNLTMLEISAGFSFHL
jgi:hypothetical protein